MRCSLFSLPYHLIHLHLQQQEDSIMRFQSLLMIEVGRDSKLQGRTFCTRIFTDSWNFLAQAFDSDVRILSTLRTQFIRKKKSARL